MSKVASEAKKDPAFNAFDNPYSKTIRWINQRFIEKLYNKFHYYKFEFRKIILGKIIDNVFVGYFTNSI